MAFSKRSETKTVNGDRMQVRVRINNGPGILFERQASGAWVDIYSGEELRVFLEKLYAKRKEKNE